jgi:hypothetical protein
MKRWLKIGGVAVAVIASLLVTVLVLTNTEGEPALQPPPPATAAEPFSTPSPTPTPPDEPPATGKVGDQLTLKITDDVTGDEYTVAAQVISYRQPYKSKALDPPDEGTGDAWGILEVRVCPLKTPTGTTDVGWEAWSLEYKDSTIAEPATSWSGEMPRPEYPYDRTVKVGRCIRGFIPFPVSSKKRPELAVYAPTWGTASLEWKIN